MLKNFMAQLFDELSIRDSIKMTEEGYYHVTISELRVNLKEGDSDLYFFSFLEPLPVHHQDQLITLLMEGNFLGQGTGGAVLGLKEDESGVTLSWRLPHEINYTFFKEKLETFINFALYWKKEILSHESANKNITEPIH